MSARLEVVKGVASQRIYFNPQQGRPSSTPTVEIKDEFGTTITAASTTSVTQNSVNTTVATANSIGDSSIVLASVTGIEYRKTYLLTNSMLQREWVRVYGVDTANKIVYFDEPLQFAHDTSATFASTEFYRTLSSSEVATLEEGWRARASYTVNSLNYVEEIIFDIVLTPLVSPLTVDFLKTRHPGIMAREHSETRGSDFQDLREQAWDKVLKGIRAHKDGWRPALLRTPEDIEEWALAEFKVLAWNAGIKVLKGEWEAENAINHLERKATTLREASLSSLKFMDFDEDDSPSADEVDYHRPDLAR